jgi:hypothetical protein
LDEDDFDFYFKDKNQTFNNISQQFKESTDLNKAAQNMKSSSDSFQFSLTVNSDESVSNKTLSPKSTNSQNDQANTVQTSNQQNPSSNGRTLPSNGINQTAKDVKQHKPIIKSQLDQSSKTKSPIVSSQILSTSKNAESAKKVEENNNRRTNPFEDFDSEILNEENDVKNANKSDILNPFLDAYAEEKKDLDENLNNPFADNAYENERNAKSANHHSSNQIDELNSISNSSTSRDLLKWCQDIVYKAKNTNKIFKDIRIENFSSSWMNGLAFCAIISHFRPNSM